MASILRKVFLSATHTHTAPLMREGVYRIPEDVIQPTEYVEFLADKVADMIEQAWAGRKAGSVSWGLGHAVVAQNPAHRVPEWHFADVRLDRPVELQGHRGLRGSRRRGAVFLEW